MQVNQNQYGGITVRGATALGSYLASWDGQGNLLEHQVDLNPADPYVKATPGSTPGGGAGGTPGAGGHSSGGPGDLFGVLIARLTGLTALPGCDCQRHIRQMNDWGWSGCLKHRDQIVTWLMEAAQRRADVLRQQADQMIRMADLATQTADRIKPGRVMSLLSAALHEARQHKSLTEKKLPSTLTAERKPNLDMEVKS